jgi:preprotein translocase subunit SecA
MRIFAGDRVRAIMDRLKMPEGEAIEAGMVTRSIESAQRKVEARNFDVRKQLLEYDDVANDQRKVIYQQRNDVLDAPSLREQITALRDGCLTDIVHQYVPFESVEEQWELAKLQTVLKDEWQIDLDLVDIVSKAEAIEDSDIVELVLGTAKKNFDAKLERVGEDNFTQFERMVLLQNLDSHWREHLSALDYLRQGIHLRGYAQKQPKQEYKREAFELFGLMLDSVRNEVSKILVNVRVTEPERVEAAAAAMEARGDNLGAVQYTAPTSTGEPEVFDSNGLASGIGPRADEVPRVGRNEPCPCGSGKKYKHCHGALT